MSTDILKQIMAYKGAELESTKRRVSLKDVRSKAADAEPARDFLGAVRGGGPGSPKVIAEIKKASPSAGVIRSDFDPLKLARIYEEAGAAALSILTDEHFFQGKLRYLEEIRRHAKIPLLRKDFIFDEYQIYEGRAAGADAILLIVRILEPNQLKDYAALASELKMSALVEVHNDSELEKGISTGTKLIGINNRDLKTFKTDLQTTIQLMEKVAKGTTIVSESGINSRRDIERLEKAGVHAFLIGETLLRTNNPATKLAELLRPS